MPADPPTRLRVARLDDVGDGEVIAVAAGDRELALYRVGSSFYATDNRCTHGAARLCDGFLDGYSIECPLHQAAFDIRTGAVERPPADMAIMTYAIQVVDGEIYVTLP